jgi:site-specific DNA-methyltransferase (adenine-specific)
MGQLTGDRPAAAYEGLAIMHRKVKKQWNGRGSYAYWSTESDEFPSEEAHYQCNGTRGEKDRHPNQKPLALCLELVAKFSNRGELVLDPFCGSGRIGEACVLLGRDYIGFDSDLRWVEVARERCRRADIPSQSPKTDEECLRLCAAPKRGK